MHFRKLAPSASEDPDVKLIAMIEVELEAEPGLDAVTAQNQLETSLQQGLTTLQSALEPTSLAGVSSGVKSGSVEVRLINRHTM
jgi:hypothetical protein